MGHRNRRNTVVVHYLWGIETFWQFQQTLKYLLYLLYITYERLKHKQQFPKTVFILCCTLPMRDWNLASFEKMWALSYITYKRLIHPFTLPSFHHVVVIRYLKEIQFFPKQKNPQRSHAGIFLKSKLYNYFSLGLIDFPISSIHLI